MGKSTIYKWPCSIAMLVYRRVPGVTLLNSGVLGFTWRHLRPGDRPQQLVGSHLHARNHVLWWLAFGALRAPDERPGVKQQKWGFNEKGYGNLLPSGKLTLCYWKWHIEISKRKIWYLCHGTSRGSTKLSLNRANSWFTMIYLWKMVIYYLFDGFLSVYQRLF